LDFVSGRMLDSFGHPLSLAKTQRRNFIWITDTLPNLSTSQDLLSYLLFLTSYFLLQPQPYLPHPTNAPKSAIRNPQSPIHNLKSAFPLSPRLLVALSVAMKSDVPIKFLPQPQPYLPHPTNAPKSEIRIPQSNIHNPHSPCPPVTLSPCLLL